MMTSKARKQQKLKEGDIADPTPDEMVILSATTSTTAASRVDQNSLSIILSFLSLPQLLLCMRVCRSFRDCCDARTTWNCVGANGMSEREIDKRVHSLRILQQERSRWDISKPTSNTEPHQVAFTLPQADGVDAIVHGRWSMMKYMSAVSIVHNYRQPTSFPLAAFPTQISTLLHCVHRNLTYLHFDWKLNGWAAGSDGLRTEEEWMEIVSGGVASSSSSSSSSPSSSSAPSPLLALSLGSYSYESRLSTFLPYILSPFLTNSLRILAIEESLPAGKLLLFKQLVYLHFRGNRMTVSFVDDIRTLTLEANLRHLFCTSLFEMDSTLHVLYPLWCEVRAKKVDHAGGYDGQPNNENPNPVHLQYVSQEDFNSRQSHTLFKDSPVIPARLESIVLNSLSHPIHNLPHLTYLELRCVRDCFLELQPVTANTLRELALTVKQVATYASRGGTQADFPLLPKLRKLSLRIKQDMSSYVMGDADWERLVSKIPNVEELELEALPSEKCCTFKGMEKLQQLSVLTLILHAPINYGALFLALGNLPSFTSLHIFLTPNYTDAHLLSTESGRTWREKMQELCQKEGRQYKPNKIPTPSTLDIPVGELVRSLAKQQRRRREKEQGGALVQLSSSNSSSSSNSIASSSSTSTSSWSALHIHLPDPTTIRVDYSERRDLTVDEWAYAHLWYPIQREEGLTREWVREIVEKEHGQSKATSASASSSSSPLFTSSSIPALGVPLSRFRIYRHFCRSITAYGLIDPPLVQHAPTPASAAALTASPSSSGASAVPFPATSSALVWGRLLC